MWRQHWDFQLFKALEYQYIQGLECINKTLPEIEVGIVHTHTHIHTHTYTHTHAGNQRAHAYAYSCSLKGGMSSCAQSTVCVCVPMCVCVCVTQVRMVFRQHKLQYDPPLEELRIRHYKDYLNTFLGLPLR